MSETEIDRNQTVIDLFATGNAAETARPGRRILELEDQLRELRDQLADAQSLNTTRERQLRNADARIAELEAAGRTLLDTTVHKSHLENAERQLAAQRTLAECAIQTAEKVGAKYSRLYNDVQMIPATLRYQAGAAQRMSEAGALTIKSTLHAGRAEGYRDAARITRGALNDTVKRILASE